MQDATASEFADQRGCSLRLTAFTQVPAQAQAKQPNILVIFDGKDIWPTVADGQPSPHDDILINVEGFRGAIRKDNWKLVKIALLPGKTELFDLSKDPGGQDNFADQFPEIASDLEARLIAYAKEKKPSEWVKARPAFLGA
jgi:arylsulfatase A-like enzyme